METLAGNATKETEYHIRNLLLNSNMTITTAPSRVATKKINTRKKEEKRVFPRRRQAKEEGEKSTALNPFASLPISLISNGTLSVTSESACVAVENGVPILKEARNTEKLPSLSNHSNYPATTLTPVEKANCSKVHFSKYSTRNLYKHNNPPGNGKPSFICSNGNQGVVVPTQRDEKPSLNTNITKLLSEATSANSFCQTGLVPNPNQMDFLTLLGLETVVDSCCRSDVPEGNQAKNKRNPIVCSQCQTDYTAQWHLHQSAFGPLCNRCYAYNEHQSRKTKQTILLEKEYAKADPLGNRKTYSTKSFGLTPLKFPLEQDQLELFEYYVKVAGAFSNDTYVSDLAKLGAWIASDSAIFQAAKEVNSLDQSSTPLVRARAVQNLQIALFKGLHHKLSLTSPSEFMIQEQPLLYIQLAIARMCKEADFTALLTENTNANATLEPIFRAIEAQLHSLIKTILHQSPATKVLSKI